MRDMGKARVFNTMTLFILEWGVGIALHLISYKKDCGCCIGLWGVT